jgi:energy-coupling factor transporter transmembrane protein EcfT
MERTPTELGAGFSVLDAAAMVLGSAIASVHLARVLGGDHTPEGWILAAVLFFWVSMTAAGPFIFLVRIVRRGTSSRPKIGDRLWALLGLPWVSTAILQSASGSTQKPPSSLYSGALSIGVAIACLVALCVIWSSWVTASPEEAARIESRPWSNRVGLILAIAWPVQCGLGLFVLS